MSYNYYHPDWYDQEGDYNDTRDVLKGCLHMILTMIAFIVLLCLVLCVVSCTTTKYVEVPVTHTDTLIQTKVQRDSIWKHDSIFVNQWQAGDTIFQVRDRWHTQYVMKERTDTFYKARVDSIPVPYPVEKQVPAELTWWQQTKMHIGGVVFWFALLAFFLWLGKKKLKL